ncbi:MAG: hypothetical protein AB1489_21390 [Acidobacteriota bacterium]
MTTRKNIFVSAIVFTLLTSAFISATSSNTNSTQEKLNPGQATITISFDGLMALCMGSPDRVSVGVLDAHHHTPRLIVTKIQNGKRSTIATLQDEQLRGTWFIDVLGAQPGISKYYTSTPESDKNDLKWAIDFNELYKQPLTIKEEKLFGKIHISAGMFYTRALTEMKYRLFATDSAERKLDFDRQIGYVGAMIDMGLGDVLVLHQRTRKIKLIAEQDTRYEISLTNVPPPTHGNIDHFLYYFDVIEERLTRYVPVAGSRAAFEPSPSICGSAVFGNSTLSCCTP